MIIETLLNALYEVFYLLTLPINIPDMPSAADNYLNQFFSYLETGAAIVANYVPLPYLLTLFSVILAVDAGILIYHLVMWVIRKIPLSID